MLTEDRKNELLQILAYGLTDDGFLKPEIVQWVQELDLEERIFLMEKLALALQRI